MPLFSEMVQLAQGFAPVNMATGANAGDWVSFANFNRIAVVIFKAAGTAGEDPVVTLEQAIAAAGTGAKALNITRVDKKQGADLFAVGQYTKSTSDSAASNDTFSTNTWTNSDLAEQQAIAIIDVRADDLDVNNGFYFLRASIADVGSGSQIGCIIYAAYEPLEAQQAMPSILA